MSAPMKRREGLEDEVVKTKLSQKDAQDKKLEDFIVWANSKDFELNQKVRVGREGSCAQYGMVATDDIDMGDVLFQIPRGILLNPETTTIKSLLEERKSLLESKSGWVPLLISLMYEYNNTTSLWRPYFDLVPDFKELDLPMFWTSTEREDLLVGTGVQEAVNTDLENLEAEFSEVVLPFVKMHQDKFSPICQDLEFYKKMVAFVMAYSFTEPIKATKQVLDGTVPSTDDSDEDDEVTGVMSPPMMVPMADILNHVANNNARLMFEKEALKMVAIKPIKKGEEVFNTYGELCNSSLLHMYGFAEKYPANYYDEVSINGQTLMEAAKGLECNPEDKFNEKKSLLEEMGLLDTSFIVGTEGVLEEDEMSLALKVWTKSDEELELYLENEGWEEEGIEESLSFDDGIQSLPKEMKLLLSRSATESLKQYKTSLDEDEAVLKKGALADRQRYSLYVNIGQKQILQKIIDCCR